MEKSISICAAIITVLLLSSFSNTSYPLDVLKDEYTIVDNSLLKISVETDEDFKFFLEAEFNEKDEDIKFLTEVATKQIRVIDQEDNNMVYLLPTGSDKVRIGKSLLSKGNYKFIFDVKGSRQVYSTNIIVH